MQPRYYQRHTQHLLTLPPKRAKDPHLQMHLLEHALLLNVGLQDSIETLATNNIGKGRRVKEYLKRFRGEVSQLIMSGSVGRTL